MPLEITSKLSIEKRWEGELISQSGYKQGVVSVGLGWSERRNSNV